MSGNSQKRTGKVRCGLDVLVNREASGMKGRNVGLLAHSASVSSEVQYAWDLLAALPDVQLRVLLSPEHGLMGTHQDLESVDSQGAGLFQGIPMYSLYGDSPDSLRPTAKMLEGLDLLLVDLQDVGSRYYTYLYTLSYCMEACQESGVEVWVLDRPNPIGGVSIEGNLVSPECRSFVGRYPFPVRHGMTIGECALMIRDYFDVPCNLRVVSMEGWKRGMWFDQTGLPWVMPSPNMPTLDTALVYPGTCLIEGTNLSEGRGTTRPFEIIGAPWVDPRALVWCLSELALPGVEFRPLWFRPTFQKFAGQICGGVQIHVLDRIGFKPFLTGVQLVRCLALLWPSEVAWRQEPYEFEHTRLAIDLLAGGSWLREVVDDGADPAIFQAQWADELQEFRKHRSKCLLYS